MAKKITFEDNLLNLEEIVEKLENTDIELDEAVKLYEKGIKLSISCDKAIAEARQKVMILAATKDGIKEVEIDYGKL